MLSSTVADSAGQRHRFPRDMPSTPLPGAAHDTDGERFFHRRKLLLRSILRCRTTARAAGSLVMRPVCCAELWSRRRLRGRAPRLPALRGRTVASPAAACVRGTPAAGAVAPWLYGDLHSGPTQRVLNVSGVL